MNREDFRKRCMAVAAGIASLDVVYGCASLPFVPFTVENEALVIRKADFGPESFVLLRVVHLPAPVFVNRRASDDYTAVLLKCTHRGCEVQPAGGRLECPCHGSRYTRAGQVIRGPAPENLQAFQVHDSDQYVHIEIGMTLSVR